MLRLAKEKNEFIINNYYYFIICKRRGGRFRRTWILVYDRVVMGNEIHVRDDKVDGEED